MEYAWLQMDKASIALVISAAALAIAGLSAIYTRRLAKNDTARMKRKIPIFEISIAESATPDGWRSVRIVSRNLEQVAVNITGAKSRSRKVLLASWSDLNDGRQDSLLAPKPRTGFAGSLNIAIAATLHPHGTKPPPPGSGPQARFAFSAADTATLSLYAKGISKPSDIAVEWFWADGQKA